MIKTKALVIMRLLVLGLLGFSGCATKTDGVVIPQKCTIEKPTPQAPRYSCAQLHKNVDDYGACLAEKIMLLMLDYKALEKAFEGCK